MTLKPSMSFFFARKWVSVDPTRPYIEQEMKSTRAKTVEIDDIKPEQLASMYRSQPSG